MEIPQNRIASAARKMQEGVADLGNVVLDKSGDIKDAAVEKGKAVYDQGAQAAREYHSQGETYIKANPYSTLAYAFGVGALIGGFCVLLRNLNTEDCD